MKYPIKRLTKKLLNAILADAKAGINNATTDRDLEKLENEYDKIYYAVKALKDLENNDDDFDFGHLREMLEKSNPLSSSMKSNIKEMIDYYNSVEEENNVFQDSEINKIVEFIFK